MLIHNLKMKLSETISRLLLEYTDRSLPIHILLEHAGNNGFGTIAGMLTISDREKLPS
jgi:hypothetical protein